MTVMLSSAGSAYLEPADRALLIDRWQACLATSDRPGVLLDATDGHRLVALNPRALAAADPGEWIGARLADLLRVPLLSAALLDAVHERCVLSLGAPDGPVELEITPLRTAAGLRPWARVVSWTPSLRLPPHDARAAAARDAAAAVISARAVDELAGMRRSAEALESVVTGLAGLSERVGLLALDAAVLAAQDDERRDRVLADGIGEVVDGLLDSAHACTEVAALRRRADVVVGPWSGSSV